MGETRGTPRAVFLRLSLRWLFLFLVAGLTIAQLSLVIKDAEDFRRELVAKEDMRRLATVSVRFFNARIPPTGEAVWAAFGRKEPLRDPWGQAYRMEEFRQEETNLFRWRSAGRDRSFGTQDDLVHRIPFGERDSREEALGTVHSGAMDAR